MKHLLYLVFILPTVAFADPMPRGLIVKGNLCSYFWAGDECATYSHESGWQEIYATNGIFHSGEKTCELPVNNAKQAAACCAQLGLKYVKVKIEKDKTVIPAASCKK
jgi:hypothetical protein